MKESPAKTVEKAMQWLEDNKEAAAYMFALAEREAESGRHFSFRLIAERTRARDFGTIKSGTFKLPNEFAPIFTRVFLKQHPEARPFVSLRKSKFDAAMQERGL